MMMMRGGTMMDCQELSKKKRKFFYGRDCGREKIMMEERILRAFNFNALEQFLIIAIF
jgi:hypothetical protein